MIFMAMYNIMQYLFHINVPILFLYNIYNILIAGHVLKGCGHHIFSLSAI